jgi:hypothetical protein
VPDLPAYDAQASTQRNTTAAHVATPYPTHPPDVNDKVNASRQKDLNPLK